MIVSQINYLNADLFSSPTSLCHCVSADFRMSKGIAVRFKELFGNVKYLKSQNIQVGNIAVLQSGNQYIYYLVTKQRAFDKPTYVSLHSSLSYMRNHMILNGISEISMPLIGCGLDGLDWSQVSKLISNVFYGTSIRINCYYL
jgi:O-acetyl-ADP-ribose deacetylase (regulator of RNase III)